MVERNRRLSLLLGATLVVAFAVYAAHALFGLGGSETNSAYDHWLYAGIVVGAAVLCLLRAMLVEAGRTGWVLVGLALLSFASGEVYWTQAVADSTGSTFPTLADLAYLGFYPLALAGVVALVSDQLRGRPAGLWLDAATVALAIAAVGSAIVIETVADGLGDDASALVEGLSYPVADLLLLSFLAAILVLCGRRPSLSLGLLAAGLAVMAAADAAYSAQLSLGTYEEGNWVDPLWPLSSLLVVAAAFAPVHRPVAARPQAGWRSLVVSATVGLTACALYSYERLAGGEPLTEILLLGSILAALARLALAFGENQRLIAEVSRDSLTGLANRGRLELDLREATGKDGEPSLLALLDLDGFERYNDSFGHPAGDELLARLGNRLAASVAGTGVAYRVGGDEFCVLVPGAGDSAERAIAMAKAAFSERGGGFDITCSIGTVRLPEEAPSPEAAIQLADRRMYQDKASSRVTAQEQAVAVLAVAQRERTPALSDHTRDVAGLAVTVGRELGLEPAELEVLDRAAELHDIGKVAIPDAILEKPGPLTTEERAFVRRHPIVGERILASAPDLLPVARIVRSSHERFDGDGYPDGLEGDQIPMASRIVFVCDAFCAMTAPRSYSAAITAHDALLELRRCASTQFDPLVVAAFAKALAEGSAEANRARQSDSRTGWLGVPRHGLST
jgi:diguanylate cyclase (GGDEF)-like protein